MKTLLIVLTTLLVGCQTIPPKAEVPVPANLLTKCERIPNIKDKANMGDLMTYSVDLMRQYNECAIRHDGLVEAVTKPSKKKD
jgi:hypothetical protein